MSTAQQQPHQITPRPVTNRWAGRFGRTPVAIVEQTLPGTLDEAFPVFNHQSDPAYDLSLHYGIGRDGQIVQFVPEEDTAWANSVVQEPDTALVWLRDAVTKNDNLNVLTVSIGYAGQSGDALTEAQYAAALWLHQQICQRWNIPTDADHIIGHNRIDSRERADSPGDAFPWHRLLYDLSLTALGHAVAPTEAAATEQPMAAETASTPEPAWNPQTETHAVQPETHPAAQLAQTETYAAQTEIHPAAQPAQTETHATQSGSYTAQQPVVQPAGAAPAADDLSLDDMPPFEFDGAQAVQHDSPPAAFGNEPATKGTLYTPDEFDELPDFLRNADAPVAAFDDDPTPARPFTPAPAPTAAFETAQPAATAPSGGVLGNDAFDDLPDFLKVDAHAMQDAQPQTAPAHTQPFAAFDPASFDQPANPFATQPAQTGDGPTKVDRFPAFDELELPDFEDMGAAHPAPHAATGAAETLPPTDIIEELNQPRTGAGALPLESVKKMPVPAQTDGDMGAVTARETDEGTPNTTGTPPGAATDADFIGVPNVQRRDFGPVKVQVELANIRRMPSYDPASIIRVGKYGDTFGCDATGEGPELFGRTLWYHVRPADGGGWVHSALVDFV